MAGASAAASRPPSSSNSAAATGFPVGQYPLRAWRWPGGGGEAAVGGRRGRRRRMFSSDELQLVILKLIADEPRHGYALIKAVEEITHGDYAPSPGVVYTSLELLEDMGLDRAAGQRGLEKAIRDHRRGPRPSCRTRETRSRRSSSGWKRAAEGRSTLGSPELGRAVGNLMNRASQPGCARLAGTRSFNEVIDILDEAARRIERGEVTTKRPSPRWQGRPLLRVAVLSASAPAP